MIINIDTIGKQLIRNKERTTKDLFCGVNSLSNQILCFVIDTFYAWRN